MKYLQYFNLTRWFHNQKKKTEQIIFGDKMKLKLHVEKTDIHGKGKDNSVTIRRKKGQKIDKETKDIS